MRQTKKTAFQAFALMAVLLASDVALAAAPPAKSTQTYYRYHNDRGVMVIDDNIPADLAKNGYDIITINGTLVERVPPALTPEQIIEKEKEKERAEEAIRVREWEASLLRRYHDVAEIEAARDRVLSEFQNQVEILRGNLNSQRAQIEVQQQRAADLERRGRPVYESIQTNIEALQKEMDTTEATIALRKKDIARVREEFEADIAQFKKIQSRRSKP